jgi:hypothetical protein
VPEIIEEDDDDVRSRREFARRIPDLFQVGALVGEVLLVVLLLVEQDTTSEEKDGDGNDNNHRE